MTFASELRKQMEISIGENSSKENPLIIIGLSASILNLGLPEDRLFKIVRGYVQRLAVQIHPDTTGRDATTDEKAIMEAFEILDNKERFHKALAEFKNLKAEDRREIRILRQAHIATRDRLEEAYKQAAAFPQLRQALEEEWKIFRKKRAEEPLVIPELKDCIDSLQEGNKRLDRNLKVAHKKIRNLNIQLNQFFRFITGLGCDFSPTEYTRTAPSVFECSVAVILTLRLMKTAPPLPFKDNLKVTRTFKEASNSAGITDDALSIAKKNLLESLNKLRKLPPVIRPKLHYSVEVYQISQGRVIEVVYPKDIDEPLENKRIIGSVNRDNFSLSRESLHLSLPRELIIKQSLPFLEERAAMVLVKKINPRIKSENISIEFRHALLQGCQRLQTTKLILYAG